MMRPRITCTWLLLPRDPTKNLGKKLPLFPYGIPKLGAHSRSSIHLLKVTPNVRLCWLLALLLSVLLSRWDLPPATLQPLTGAFRVLAFIYLFVVSDEKQIGCLGDSQVLLRTLLCCFGNVINGDASWPPLHHDFSKNGSILMRP